MRITVDEDSWMGLCFAANRVLGVEHDLFYLTSGNEADFDGITVGKGFRDDIEDTYGLAHLYFEFDTEEDQSTFINHFTDQVNRDFPEMDYEITFEEERYGLC